MKVLDLWSSELIQARNETYILALGESMNDVHDLIYNSSKNSYNFNFSLLNYDE